MVISYLNMTKLFNKTYTLNEIIDNYENNNFESMCMILVDNEVIRLLTTNSSKSITQENSRRIALNGCTKY